MNSLRLVLFLVSGLCLASCIPLRDSPFSDMLERHERDLNTSALHQLQSRDIEADGVIRIGVFADPHENYDDLDRAIAAINQVPALDFVAGLGDYSDMGYNVEYDRFLSSYVNLNAPSLVAVGNHDALGRGLPIFTKAFGPYNFYFESTSFRFIFWNSANWEDENAFDPSWLERTVSASSKPVIIFTHVSLLDDERFPDDLGTRLARMVDDPKVVMVLNGHKHVYSLGNRNGTVLLQVARTQGVQWMVVEIQPMGMCGYRDGSDEGACVAFKH